MKLRFINQLSEINGKAWDDLRKDKYPFLSSAFLGALETSGCVGGESGWTPMHIVGEEGGELVLALPLYVKGHSYGEYVFDWQWARAFEAHGQRYFPKLLSAIPFTPATGPRLLTKRAPDKKTIDALFDFIVIFAKQNSLSSWHMLFPDESLKSLLSTRSELLLREDVQFHWHNRGFTDFESYLKPFRANKRKQIRRERRKVAEQGVQLKKKTGNDLTKADWQDFYQCYKATYYKRSGHSGYLNWEFFEQISKSLNDQVVLVFAHSDQGLVASSLFFMDEDTLYGRYWGTLVEVDCLHFEACYYQGIDFAIEKGLKYFNPGTQGEHKLMRGFEPTKTSSYHWIANPEFASAIGDYLVRERVDTDGYEQAASNYLPFRRNID